MSRVKSMSVLRVATLTVVLGVVLALSAISGALGTQSNQSTGSRFGSVGTTAERNNMRLIGHDDLQGRGAYKGHVQEQNGRFIAYVGHHRGQAFNPLTGQIEDNGVSIVDVTDPSNPEYLHHLVPVVGVGEGGQMRSVQTCAGDDLPNGEPGKYYLQTESNDEQHEVWDVTNPSSPELLAVIQSGLLDTHKNWWECSTGIAYLTGTVPGWNTRSMSIFDLSDPANPTFIRTFGLAGSQPGEDPAGRRMTEIHEPLYLNGRVYMAYGTSADGILQILDNDELLNGDFDPNNPTDEQLLAPQIARLDWPNFQGVHTAVPQLGMDVPEFEDFAEGTPRDMLVVVNESNSDECDEEMHQMVHMVDITDVTHPIPVDTYFVPEATGNFCERGGRFGAHSMQWNLTEEHYRNRIAWVSYFNAGIRGVDIRDPFNLSEVAYFIPAVTENTDWNGQKVIQTNNVDVDDDGFVYTFDRANTGMHILWPTGEAARIAGLPNNPTR